MVDFANVGTNVKYNIEGDMKKGEGVLVMRVKLAAKGNLSASGKNETIATTHGNQPVPGTSGFKFSVNVFKPNPDYKPE